MRRDGGYVLLEALIAAAIVAAMLAVLFDAARTNVRAARSVADARAALLVARSRLDAAGTTDALRPGETRGTEGPLVWAVRIEPYGPGTAAGTPMLVTARVEARGRVLARLATLKLAPRR